ncbi:MAG TPA: hypothetical protein VGK67_26085 [Myxococcales bacterium]|jgi:hypothetical protein
MRKIRVFPLLMALGLCLGLVGCKKPAAPPSKEYFKARTMWIDLLREKRSKAYVAPEAEEVIELLRLVDAKSLDATSAQTLLEEIQGGRAKARAEEAELQEKIETAKRAGQADPSQLVFHTLPSDGGGVASAAAGGRPDAGPKEPTVGMSQSEFASLFGRCFEFRNDAVVGGVAGGQVWGLRDSMGCRQDFPSFVANSVLVVDGRVGAIRSSAELAPVKYKMVDGKLVPMTGEDEKAGLPPAPAPQAAPERNSANLTDATPKANQNLTDATPKANQNLTDVTPKPAANPNDVTPR